MQLQIISFDPQTTGCPYKVGTAPLQEKLLCVACIDFSFGSWFPCNVQHTDNVGVI